MQFCVHDPSGTLVLLSVSSWSGTGPGSDGAGRAAIGADERAAGLGDPRDLGDLAVSRARVAGREAFAGKRVAVPGMERRQRLSNAALGHRARVARAAETGQELGAAHEPHASGGVAARVARTAGGGRGRVLVAALLLRAGPRRQAGRQYRRGGGEHALARPAGVRGAERRRLAVVARVRRRERRRGELAAPVGLAALAHRAGRRRTRGRAHWRDAFLRGSLGFAQAQVEGASGPALRARTVLAAFGLEAGRRGACDRSRGPAAVCGAQDVRDRRVGTPAGGRAIGASSCLTAVSRSAVRRSGRHTGACDTCRARLRLRQGARAACREGAGARGSAAAFCLSARGAGALGARGRQYGCRCRA